ncbi:MATE family efflux transporter [Rubritalea spongiae]|uniref:Multidrug-efflux transporter n=1 Tax=Rubritalea spongiae TaxID=430797 RepID=A0ABW5E635_9BACT
MSNPANAIDPPSHPRKSVVLGGRLAGISLTKQIVTLALWPFLQNLMGTVVSFADRIIAGNTMSAEVHSAVFDAMGLAMYVAWLMMILQGAVATGAQALVSRAFGAHDAELTEKATGQSLILGAISGALSGIIVWFLAPLLIQGFGLSGVSEEYAMQYLRIVSLSSPLCGLLFVANACLRAGGDTRTPFYAMLVVNIVNVSLSILFMTKWMPPGNGVDGVYTSGMAGLAWGTVGGWLAGAVVILWTMLPRNWRPAVVTISKEALTWDWKIGYRIVRVGFPQVIEIIGMWSIHAYGVWMVAKQLTQEGALGAHGMVVQIESMSFMPGFALGMAASTLAGQYLGAQSKELAAHAVRVCWYVAIVVMGLTGICLVVFAPQLVGLMSPEGGKQAEMAIFVLRYVGWVQPFFATAMVMKMSMRGAGATVLVMVSSFGTMLIIRVGLLSAGFYYFGDQMTLTKVWLIMMTDLVVQALVFAALHFRGKWLDAEV